MESVTIYSTGCPRCKVLIRKLQDNKVTFSICDDISIMENKGIVSVPMLEWKGQLYNFSESVQLVNRGELSGS